MWETLFGEVVDFVQGLGLFSVWQLVEQIVDSMPPIVVAFVAFLNTALMVRILMKVL